MSGGAWGCQQHRLRELAEEIESGKLELPRLIRAVADSEKIVDWSECGDTVRRREDGTGAEKDLYDLWLETFEELYGR